MILVTGVAGFIGSKVAEFLIKQGGTVVGVDNLSLGNIANLPQGVIFENLNLGDTHLVNSLDKYGKFDAIYHIAGQSGGEPSYDDPVEDLNSNTASTLNLLSLATKSPDCVFVYASTVSVYGENGKTHQQQETDECKPKSFYGVGKLASEHYLRIYAEQYGLRTRALRLFNIYGPGQSLDNMRQGMVSIFLSQALRQSEITVKGSGDRYRDFVYIDDAVKAFYQAAKHSSPGHFTVNISTGIPTSVSALCSLISTEFGQIKITHNGATPGDIHGYTGDASEATKILGWTAETPLRLGIAKMATWAKAHGGFDNG